MAKSDSTPKDEETLVTITASTNKAPAQMSRHLFANLIKLANQDGCGYHFGSLNALVKRGLAERYKSNDCYGHYCLGYRITDSGYDAIAKEYGL